MKEKIVLGTVQLGLSYGINNATGKPSDKEANEILDFAYHHGVRTLDTADAYGDSLQVIGRYTTSSDNKFKIINKFKIDSISLTDKVNSNLHSLNYSSLYCYMYHQFSDYKSGLASKELAKLKGGKKIEKTGISIYTTHQLEQVIDDPAIDIIQLPVNMLDLTAKKKILLKKARSKGKEIHARSIYLQGLLLKEPTTLTGNLIDLKPYLVKLNEMAASRQASLKVLALNFVILQDYIDAVVLGVETVDQLRENLQAVNPMMDIMALEVPEVEAKDIELLNPSNWKL